MRPSKYLGLLEYATCRNLRRIRHSANEVVLAPRDRNCDLMLAAIVVDTLNTWGNFLRSYCISFMLGTRATSKKRIVTRSPCATVEDAIDTAIRVHNPRAITPPANGWHRRDEPPWHDHNLVLKLSRSLQCSCYTDIQAAFSFSSRVYIDLPVFRNYYAHRNEQTSKAVRNLAPQYGIPATRRPTQILLSIPINRPQQLVLDMLDDLLFTVSYLCN